MKLLQCKSGHIDHNMSAPCQQAVFNGTRLNIIQMCERRLNIVGAHRLDYPVLESVYNKMMNDDAE